MRRSLSIIAVIIAGVFAVFAEQWALVQIPVACMRKSAGHSSELVSQAVLGTPLKVHGRNGDWLSVETPDGYRGMMRANSARLLSQSEFDTWRSNVNRRVCLAPMLDLRLQIKDGEGPGYATFGAILPDCDPRLESVTAPLRAWAETAYKERSADAVISMAMKMLGDPYLWGGTSALAVDCSGFTQIAYMAAGIVLPRDAWQQALAGTPIASIKEAKPGDLLFYAGASGKVNHVAMYLGDGKIIHSSGSVRICRMSASVPGDEEVYSSKPVAIRSYLGSEEPEGFAVLREHPFYFK